MVRLRGWVWALGLVASGCVGGGGGGGSDGSATDTGGGAVDGTVGGGQDGATDGGGAGGGAGGEGGFGGGAGGEGGGGAGGDGGMGGDGGDGGVGGDGGAGGGGEDCGPERPCEDGFVCVDGGCEPTDCLQVEVARARSFSPAAVRASFVVRGCNGTPYTQDLEAAQVSVVNGETGAPFGATPDSGGASAPRRLVSLLAEGGAPTVGLYTILALDRSTAAHDAGEAAAVIAAARGVVDTLVRNAPADQRHRVAIQIYGRTDATRVVQAFTADAAVLDRALDALVDAPALGAANLYGAYEAALGLLAAEAEAAEVVSRHLVLVAGGSHAAGDAVNLRAQAERARDAAAAGGVVVHTVALAPAGDDAASLAALITPSGGYLAAAGPDGLGEVVGRTAQRIRQTAAATWVVGLCTPVELGTPGLEVAVTVGALEASGVNTYDAGPLNGALAGCDPERVVSPCGAATCGPSALAGLACGRCGDAEICGDGGRCACIEGRTEERVCGLNDRGTQARTCTDGEFEAWSPCADPDQCVDGSNGDRVCPGGEVRQQCVAGRWSVAEHTCPCQPGDGPPCNGCPAGTLPPAGMVCAPAGTYTRGSPLDEDARALEEVQHAVTLTRPFFLGRTEVTQAEWRALMGTAPWTFVDCGDTCPVDNISWADAKAYANARSAAEGLDPCYDQSGLVIGPSPYACEGYRLPTEAEWEYAARAGTTTAYFWGEDPDEAPNYAWFGDNADFEPHPVGLLAANPWGLFDITGNLEELCQDRYAPYPAGAVTDPWGPAQSQYIVLRGGSWITFATQLRSAYRLVTEPEGRTVISGLRLARTAPR